ncbi:MAG: RNA-binding cell elongation regulator Jag/EloR [Bacillota bacterium]
MNPSRSVVKSGRSVEEALEAALDELGVGRDDVDVEVLEEANRGLLGWIGGRLARIRVTVKEKEGPGTEERRGRRDRRARAGLLDEAEVAGGAGSEPDSAQAAERLDRARDFLRQVVHLIGSSCVIETHRMGPGLYKLNIVSERAGLLIGHRGETLNALQYLVNVAANRREQEGAPVRFVLDTADYRRRRENVLRQVALRAARRVREEKRRVALEPMSATERRVIHLALKDDPYVETRSEGEEPNRRVVVFPRGQAPPAAAGELRGEDGSVRRGRPRTG